MQARQPVVIVVDGEALEAAAGLHQQLEDVVASDCGRPMQGSLRPVPLLAAYVEHVGADSLRAIQIWVMHTRPKRPPGSLRHFLPSPTVRGDVIKIPLSSPQKQCPHVCMSQ